MMGRYLDMALQALRGNPQFPRKFPRNRSEAENRINSDTSSLSGEVSAFIAYSRAHVREDQPATAAQPPLRGNAKNAETPLGIDEVSESLAFFASDEVRGNLRDNPLPAEPLLLRDGRRMWRWRAAAIPAAPGAEVRDAVDRARWCGCTIIADGCDLILVEPWLSRLPPEVRDALAADPGAAIAVLRIGRTP